MYSSTPEYSSMVYWCTAAVAEAWMVHHQYKPLLWVDHTPLDARKLLCQQQQYVGQ